MKKINFKDLPTDEILSREELRRIVAGNGSDGSGYGCESDSDCPEDKQCDSVKKLCYNNSTGYAVPCPTPDGTCVTRDGEIGTCGTYQGIYGCH